MILYYMVYAIVEYSYDNICNNTKKYNYKITGFTDSIDKFAFDLQQIYTDAKYINYITKNELAKKDCFECGKYIIVNNMNIYLVKKYEKYNKGFLFNDLMYVLDIIIKWKFIIVSIDNTNSKYVITKK